MTSSDRVELANKVTYLANSKGINITGYEDFYVGLFTILIELLKLLPDKE